MLTIASEPAVFERNSVLLTRPSYRALRAIGSTPVKLLLSRMIELRWIIRELFVQPIVLPSQLYGDLLDKVGIKVAQQNAPRPFEKRLVQCLPLSRFNTEAVRRFL